jgi:hypothetical protein
MLKFFKNATRIDSKVVRSVHSWRQEEKRARLAHFLFPKVSQSQHAHIYVVGAVAHFQGGNARNNNRASVKLDNAFVH